MGPASLGPAGPVTLEPARDSDARLPSAWSRPHQQTSRTGLSPDPACPGLITAQPYHVTSQPVAQGPPAPDSPGLPGPQHRSAPLTSSALAGTHAAPRLGRPDTLGLHRTLSGPQRPRVHCWPKFSHHTRLTQRSQKPLPAIVYVLSSTSRKGLENKST
jgi:hypothetical protein